MNKQKLLDHGKKLCGIIDPVSANNILRRKEYRGFQAAVNLLWPLVVAHKRLGAWYTEHIFKGIANKALSDLEKELNDE